jgi:hypothetical protein
MRMMGEDLARHWHQAIPKNPLRLGANQGGLASGEATAKKSIPKMHL